VDCVAERAVVGLVDCVAERAVAGLMDCVAERVVAGGLRGLCTGTGTLR